MAIKPFSISTTTVRIEITGVCPLLIHRFREENEVDGGGPTRPAKRKRITDTKAEALLAANRDPKGLHYISAFAIINSMVATGQNHKQRGSRKNMGYLVPSACRVVGDDPDIIHIYVDDHIAKDGDVIVDARPVVIPATKGRIMRYRPKYERWSLRFEMTILTDLIDTDTAHMFLNEAGLQIGVGDFRPQKRGPFGTFRVTRWDEVHVNGDSKSPKAKAAAKEQLAASAKTKAKRGRAAATAN